jgi:hypothetical protein
MKGKSERELSIFPDRKIAYLLQELNLNKIPQIAIKDSPVFIM